MNLKKSNGPTAIFKFLRHPNKLVDEFLFWELNFKLDFLEFQKMLNHAIIFFNSKS
jgi:hypothetical protein